MDSIYVFASGSFICDIEDEDEEYVYLNNGWKGKIHKEDLKEATDDFINGLSSYWEGESDTVKYISDASNIIFEIN